MREIKFRGKRIDNGEWVYGDLVQNPWSTRIVVDFVLIDGCNDGTVECGGDFYLVDPRTVGQFTGLQDSKGVDIYEGDIVKHKHSNQEDEKNFYWEYQIVNFHNGSFGFEGWCTNKNGELNKKFMHYSLSSGEFYEQLFDIEVIGNIHENPELLK